MDSDQVDRNHIPEPNTTNLNRARHSTAESGPASVSSVASTNIAFQHPAQSNLAQLDFDDYIPSCWGLLWCGDEAKEGPIYNYARVFTSHQFSQIIYAAFKEAVHKYPLPPLVRSHPSQGGPVAEDRQQLARSIGFPTTENPNAWVTYLAWKNTNANIPAIPFIVWRDMFLASLLALFVQWGTTGPSIAIGYLTPPKGLGCRSGSYLLYGCAATLSWLLLVVSSMLSHALMLRCQSRSNNRGLSKGLLPALYAITRILGYVVAAANAVWLLVSTIFELVGIFDGCWCNTDALSVQSRGWVVLFESTQQLAGEAQQVWIGGIIAVCIVCLLTTLVISLGCKR